LIELDVQRAYEGPDIPGDDRFENWVELVLAGEGDVMVNVRIVDEAEGMALNKRWRGREGATNVLSFPASSPPAGGIRVLGDVVLCAPVVAREAAGQGKPAERHWAHLTVHGLLHLLGFDHTTAEQAEVMEAREIQLLGQLGIPDPYDL